MNGFHPSLWPSPGGESAQTAGSNWWTSSALCRPGGYGGSMNGKAAGSGTVTVRLGGGITMTSMTIRGTGRACASWSRRARQAFGPRTGTIPSSYFMTSAASDPCKRAIDSRLASASRVAVATARAKTRLWISAMFRWFLLPLVQHARVSGKTETIGVLAVEALRRGLFRHVVVHVCISNDGSVPSLQAATHEASGFSNFPRGRLRGRQGGWRML